MEILLLDSKQICATFALERDMIFILLDSKQTCSLFQRVTLSPRLLTRWAETKLLLLLLAMLAEIRETSGELSPNRKSKYT